MPDYLIITTLDSDTKTERIIRAKNEAQAIRHVIADTITIDRAITLWSNPGETVLTPFMGIGSEVYAAVCLGRRGVGMELKASYYRQAARNVAAAKLGRISEEQVDMFEEPTDEEEAA